MCIDNLGRTKLITSRHSIILDKTFGYSCCVYDVFYEAKQMMTMTFVTKKNKRALVFIIILNETTDQSSIYLSLPFFFLAEKEIAFTIIRFK